jgi:predicted ATPase
VPEVPVTTIRTPDQRLRVFVSSTLEELAPERAAASRAIEAMRLSPVMFELGARPHPPRKLYLAYLEQSQVFVGIYWQRYGWVAPEMDLSGLEDEYAHAVTLPKLIYVKTPAPEREERLDGLLDRVRADGGVSYKSFETADELQSLIENDLALLLTENFESAQGDSDRGGEDRVRLPEPVDAFVGREEEIVALGKYLIEGPARLVTLTGPGGVGKTRLALETAARFGEAFADGTHYIPLASVAHADLVVPTIVQALNVQSSAADPLEALIEHLRDKKSLLLLDNFEQVVFASPEIARMVEHCSQITVLVTSRAILHLRGEIEFPVPPLGVPPDNEPADRLLEHDAVRLFVERARAMDHAFVLDASNGPVVAAICRRLDGLPLAVELAAARIRMLSPEWMLDHIDKSLSLLSRGSRDAPERHQTLHAAIDWSYGLLDDNEKKLFARLGAFQGGWTLEAAEKVCVVDDDIDVLEIMTSLLEKSLIKHQASGGEPRFSMLQTVYDYASTQLAEAPDSETTYRAHARFFLHLIGAAHDGLRSPHQVEWLARLEADNGNLRAALRWCLDHGEIEEVAQAGWTLWLFWWINGHLGEGRQLMQEALEGGELQPIPCATATAVQGVMAFWQTDYAAGVPLLTEALEIARDHGFIPAVALCQLPLGFVDAASGDGEKAKARYEESVAAFKAMDDDWGTAISLNAYAWMCLGADIDPGEDLYTEAVERAEKLGTQFEHGMALRNYGGYRARNGALAEGKQLLASALRLLWRGAPGVRNTGTTRVRGGSTYAIDGLAEIAAEEGEARLAAQLFAATHGIRETTGSAIMPMFAGRFEGYVDRVRNELGAEFEVVWKKGRELGMDAAAELALEWAEKELSLQR